MNCSNGSKFSSEEELVVVYLTRIIPATGLNNYSTLRNGIYQAIVE